MKDGTLGSFFRRLMLRIRRYFRLKKIKEQEEDNKEKKKRKKEKRRRKKLININNGVINNIYTKGIQNNFIKCNILNKQHRINKKEFYEELPQLKSKISATPLKTANKTAFSGGKIKSNVSKEENDNNTKSNSKYNKIIGLNNIKNIALSMIFTLVFNLKQKSDTIKLRIVDKKYKNKRIKENNKSHFITNYMVNNETKNKKVCCDKKYSKKEFKNKSNDDPKKNIDKENEYVKKPIIKTNNSERFDEKTESLFVSNKIKFEKQYIIDFNSIINRINKTIIILNEIPITLINKKLLIIAFNIFIINGEIENMKNKIKNKSYLKYKRECRLEKIMLRRINSYDSVDYYINKSLASLNEFIYELNKRFFEDDELALFKKSLILIKNNLFDQKYRFNFEKENLHKNKVKMRILEK